MSTWLRSAWLLGAVLGVSACAIPYPVVKAGGPFEVPANGSTDPLGAGASVTPVTQTPPGCRSVGLATGVGGTEAYEPRTTSDVHYGPYRAQALIALRNAVGEAGGTHVRVDAEVRFTDAKGRLTHVLLRGDALACGR